MRIILICILLAMTGCKLFGQNIRLELNVSPIVSIPNYDIVPMKYEIPIPLWRYEIYENEYKRDSKFNFGTDLGLGLAYSISKKIRLLSGVSFKYLGNTLITSISSSSLRYSDSREESPLIHNENIRIYHPYDFEGNIINIIIDENGIPVSTFGKNFNDYKVNESIKSVYLSIPMRLGYALLREDLELIVGGTASILIYSNIKKEFPYTYEGIFDNKISSINRFSFSINAGVSYYVSRKMYISLYYHYSLTNTIEIYKRYQINNGQKINTLSLGLNFELN